MTTLRRLGAFAALALCLSACGELLKVSNPGSLQEGQLSDPALEQFVINGAIGEFQLAYGTYVFWSGALADEVFTDHANAGFRPVALHNFDDLDLVNDSVYKTLQRARQSADDASERIKTMLGPSAASSLNVARALIYGGYAYVLLAEGFCDAPVRLGAALTPNELFARSITRFDEGITIGNAARTGTNVAAAQDLIYLAQVGAARASLKKGDLVGARSYAALVPDAYERWAYYSANSLRENNALQIGIKASAPFLAMHPAFQGLADARVPQPTASRMSLGSNPILPPLKPSSYSGWTATAPAQAIDVASHIRFASGLEARYIGVESDGPGGAMLAFVNARRAVAGKPPLNLNGAALVAEFRLQRAIDFYLTGQRLGDLRRYAAAGTDLFPTGKFPVGADLYGSMHCFIVPRSEKTGNPNS